MNITRHAESGPPLTITLVGVGGFGNAHLQAVRRMEAEGQVRLQNVIDPHPERLPDAYAALRERGVGWYLNWDELVAAAPPSDCVILAVPIPLHMDYAIKAYQTGAYVYLEKPPVPLLGQLDQLIAMEGDDRRIQVGFTFPYSRQMQALKARILDGKLGEILSYGLAACWPRPDSYYSRTSWAGKLWDRGHPVFDGPATNALAHRLYDFLDLESLVSGQPAIPESVCAEMYRARPIPSYDVSSARGVFPSGASFSYALSHASSAQTDLRLEITGTKGRAVIQQFDIEITGNFPTERLTNSTEVFYDAHRDFLKTARERGRPLIGLESTRPYVATTNAMFLSSGDIHSITAENYQEIETLEGTIYHVDGLNDYSLQVMQTGGNFSDTGAPWGIPGREITLDHSLAATMEKRFSLHKDPLAEKLTAVNPPALLSVN